MKTGVKVLIFIGILLFIIIGIFVGAKIWLNYTWFGKLGYLNVFTKILWTKISLWFIFFFLFLIFSGFNVFYAFKKGNIQKIKFQQQGMPIELSRKIGVIISMVALLILGLIMAKNGSSRWEIILKYFNKTSFNTQDPLFHRDISFYVFTLPVYIFLKSWSLGTIILTLLAVSFLYMVSGNVSMEYNKLQISDQAKRHVLFLVSLIGIIIAWNFWLKTYDLLFSKRGLIFGAGYTDVKVTRPGYLIMIAVSLFATVITLIGAKKGMFKHALIGFGSLIGAAILLTGIIPAAVQGISVKPNELVKELPYIKNNIELTRIGYNLNSITTKPFPVRDDLTADDFSDLKGIKKHIRLWDHRPLKSTFSQLQEFRLYYDFYDVDVDRYHLGNEYRQVMLSAREINYNELPQEAKTWVNERLQFTHGYGVVMSPVNEIGEEGLPVFFIKDIPPKISVPLKLDRPEIYYGEETIPYIPVNTKLEEFDYPKGNKNVTTRYKGSGGIEIKNGFRRLLLAIQLKSVEIIFTNYINPDSRLMIYRSIQERVPKIAPFLKYDSNPYIVINNGKLYWMLDAYTISDKFPYSQPYKDGYNYIRNSVKITVDAYNGDVTFYVIDKKDPIISTYMKIFPNMFKDISEMPKGLLAHVRYPLYMFDVQANLYSTYHMTDPQVFYNKEDKWTIPHEIYEESEIEMTPYYTIVRFPDSRFDSEEFVLMLPFTPTNKNNMVAWVAAMCDPQNYGQIIEYKFPKEKLIFGPLQIESRIDQNSEISKLFTLWGQRGSKVIRGNLLVIPVKDSLIYIEPIYLRAEQSELPELKRVIVGYQDRIGVGLRLEDALFEIFGAGTPLAAEAGAKKITKAQAGELNLGDLIDKAVSYFQEAQNRLKQGDFSGYGEYIKQLQNVLLQLKENSEK